MADDTRIKLADACLLLNYSTQSYSNCINNNFNNEDMNHQSLQTTTTTIPANREPIHNLLAAVNCALPGIRITRPNILQRFTNNQSIKSTQNYDDNNTISNANNNNNNNNNNLTDHDYCQQDSDNNKSSLNNNSDKIDKSSGLSADELKCSFNSNERKSCDIKSLSSNSKSSSKRKQMHSKSSLSINNFDNSIKPLKLVAIHLGAGNSHKESESMQLAKTICEEIMLQTSPLCYSDNVSFKSNSKRRKAHSLNDFNCNNNNDIYSYQSNSFNENSNTNQQNQFKSSNAENAVVQLIKKMEDHQNLNCGYGSNLNIMGQVECDASLMCDKTQMWAGVGAVSGCKNPILLAKSLYDYRALPRPLGLIQPNLLVGSGAKQWMREHCPQLSIMDNKLVSSKAFSTYQKLKSKYDAIVRSSNQNYPNFTKTKSSPNKRDDNSNNNKTDIGKCNDNRQTNCSIAEDNNYKTTAITIVDILEESIKKEKIDDHHAKDNDNNSSDIVKNENLSIKGTNYNQVAATSLDHGFYCIKTGDNLKKVPSFAKAINRFNQFNQVQSIDLYMERETDKKAAIEKFGDVLHHFDSNHTNKLETNDSIESQLVNLTEDYRLDTVGAIAVDCDNNFASAISSGGLLLKYKGRIGQAAIPGAGCWSEDSVAVTTTGVGEYLTLNMFARKFYDKMLTLRLLYDLGHVEKKPDLSNLISCGMNECFEDLMKSAALEHVAPQERLAGMLSVSSLNSKDSSSRVDENDLYLSYAHNTKSMCIGYMTCNDVVGHSIMSRKTEEPIITQAKENPFNSSIILKPNTLVKTIKFSLDLNNYSNMHIDNHLKQNK